MLLSVGMSVHCSKCAKLQPLLGRLGEALEDVSIDVAQLDLSKNDPDSSLQTLLTGFPTVLYYAKGQEPSILRFPEDNNVTYPLLQRFVQNHMGQEAQAGWSHLRPDTEFILEFLSDTSESSALSSLRRMGPRSKSNLRAAESLVDLASQIQQLKEVEFMQPHKFQDTPKLLDVGAAIGTDVNLVTQEDKSLLKHCETIEANAVGGTRAQELLKASQFRLDLMKKWMEQLETIQ